MRILAVSVALLAFASSAQAQSSYGTRSYGYGSSGGYGTGSNSQTHTVSPYTTQSGAYVAPHVATNPNHTQTDNFSTRGNYNPNTGAYGTRSPRF